MFGTLNHLTTAQPAKADSSPGSVSETEFDERYKALNAARRLIMSDCGYSESLFLLSSRAIVVMDAAELAGQAITDTRSSVIDGGYTSENLFLDTVPHGRDTADFVLYKPQNLDMYLDLQVILNTAGNRYFDILDTPDDKQIVIYRFGFEALVDSFTHGGYVDNEGDIPEITFNMEFRRELIKEMKLEKAPDRSPNRPILSLLQDMLWQDCRHVLGDLPSRMGAVAVASLTEDPRFLFHIETKLPDTYPGCKSETMTVVYTKLGFMAADFIIYRPFDQELAKRIYESTTVLQRRYVDIIEFNSSLYIVLHKPLFQALMVTIRLNTSGSLGCLTIPDVDFNVGFYDEHIKKLNVLYG